MAMGQEAYGTRDMVPSTADSLRRHTDTRACEYVSITSDAGTGAPRATTRKKTIIME
jgi:hypothetical protein